MNEGYKLRIKTFILHFLIIVKSYYLLVSQLASGKKIWPLIKSRSVKVCYRTIGGNARFLLYTVMNDTGPERYLGVSVRAEGKKYTRESVTRTSRISINVHFFLSFFFADRAAAKGLEVRGRDSHGAGGAETGGGRKSGEAGGISTESRDLRQIIAERKSGGERKLPAARSLECEDGLSCVV